MKTYICLLVILFLGAPAFAEYCDIPKSVVIVRTKNVDSKRVCVSNHPDSEGSDQNSLKIASDYSVVGKVALYREELPKYSDHTLNASSKLYTMRYNLEKGATVTAKRIPGGGKIIVRWQF